MIRKLSNNRVQFETQHKLKVNQRFGLHYAPGREWPILVRSVIENPDFSYTVIGEIIQSRVK